VKLPSELKTLPPAVTNTDAIASNTVAQTKINGCVNDISRIMKPAQMAMACAKTPSGASCERSSAMSMATGTIAAMSHSGLSDTSSSMNSGTSPNIARPNARASNIVPVYRRSRNAQGWR
jgi:hypothetical protein